MLYASPTSQYQWFGHNVVTDIIIFSPSLCYFLHRRSRYCHEHNFCVYPQDYSQNFDNLKRITQNGVFFLLNNVTKSRKISRRNFMQFFINHSASHPSVRLYLVPGTNVEFYKFSGGRFTWCRFVSGDMVLTCTDRNFAACRQTFCSILDRFYRALTTCLINVTSITDFLSSI
jgi:hypothetical protein